VAVPQVDFYVLPGEDPAARLRFACRLVEKAWLKRHRVRVQFEPGGDLEAFDRMLWTFSDRAFIPHRRAGSADDAPATAPAPVVIADNDAADAADGDVLVNLSAAQPAAGTWSRIAEVIDADGARRSKGRERFRAYREQGLDPQTHDMKDEA
jgi:DNA polymerase III subunit chi